MADYQGQYTGAQIDALLGKANTALQSHQDISGKADKMVAKTTLPTAVSGITTLESGKKYGTESAPIDITGKTINCKSVADETLLYYSITASATIQYKKRVGDIPSDAGNYVLSAKDGVVIVGQIENE